MSGDALKSCYSEVLTHGSGTDSGPNCTLHLPESTIDMVVRNNNEFFCQCTLPLQNPAGFFSGLAPANDMQGAEHQDPKYSGTSTVVAGRTVVLT